jgi:Xaa-Pro aminopeptidase
VEHESHQALQTLAKGVLSSLGSTITAEDTESSIAARAIEYLRKRDINETWYYQCPALVLLGSRSTLSVSGRVYRTAEERVGEFNLVTVDLSPKKGEVWADCARSFPIEGGHFVQAPMDVALLDGLSAERTLHETMVSSVRPTTTFSELHAIASATLAKLGYENLDLGKNFGHSIPTHLGDRTYIVAGNNRALGSVGYFTFEPHIRRPNGAWGFKHEDIYYFDAKGHACAL